MTAIVIIPARMGSSRFPGKPLEKIHGIPMIGHCFYRASMCKDVVKTYVATCDSEIAEYVTSIGGDAVMTSKSHERASDRTAEAMLSIEKKTNTSPDIVVMLQGDEPMITPTIISRALVPFRKEPEVKVVNLMARIPNIMEFKDPNEIKVVVDKKGDAIYFSREPIPSQHREGNHSLMLKQVCVIPFRRDYLLEFNNLPETELERLESVDMMRIIENNGKVRMVMSDIPTWSVDTAEDLEKVEKKMTGDKLMQKYN